MFFKRLHLLALPGVALAAITPPVVVQDAQLSILDDTKVPVGDLEHYVGRYANASDPS